MVKSNKPAVKPVHTKTRKLAPRQSVQEMIAEEVGKQMAALIGELSYYTTPRDSPGSQTDSRNISEVNRSMPVDKVSVYKSEAKLEAPETMLQSYLRGMEDNLYRYRNIARTLVILHNKLTGADQKLEFKEIAINPLNISESLNTISYEHALLFENMEAILKEISVFI
jgi:hypothetical protein